MNPDDLSNGRKRLHVHGKCSKLPVMDELKMFPVIHTSCRIQGICHGRASDEASHRSARTSAVALIYF